MDRGKVEAEGERNFVYLISLSLSLREMQIRYTKFWTEEREGNKVYEVLDRGIDRDYIF